MYKREINLSDSYLFSLLKDEILTRLKLFVLEPKIPVNLCLIVSLVAHHGC